jgi:hypothetical protein
MTGAPSPDSAKIVSAMANIQASPHLYCLFAGSDHGSLLR